jgi:hypothetical protein
LNAVDPQLESAQFQPSNPSSESPISKFAFKFNLYRYNKVYWGNGCQIIPPHDAVGLVLVERS